MGCRCGDTYKVSWCILYLLATLITTPISIQQTRVLKLTEFSHKAYFIIIIAPTVAMYNTHGLPMHSAFHPKLTGLFSKMNFASYGWDSCPHREFKPLYLSGPIPYADKLSSGKICMIFIIFMQLLMFFMSYSSLIGNAIYVYCVLQMLYAKAPRWKFWEWSVDHANHKNYLPWKFVCMYVYCTIVGHFSNIRSHIMLFWCASPHNLQLSKSTNLGFTDFCQIYLK